MTNPFDLAYLMEASSTFGPAAWIFFILQVVGVLAGFYFLFKGSPESWQRRLGIALIVVGNFGVGFAILRLVDMPMFNQRYWFYLQLILELGLTGYMFYYVRVVYPRQVQQLRSSQSRGRAKRRVTQSVSAHNGGNGTLVEEIEQRSVATTSRRESRRERKRKNR